MFPFSRRDKLNSRRRSRIFKSQATYRPAPSASRGGRSLVQGTMRLLPKLALGGVLIFGVSQGWQYISSAKPEPEAASGRIAVALPGQSQSAQQAQSEPRPGLSVVNAQAPQRASSQAQPEPELAKPAEQVGSTDVAQAPSKPEPAVSAPVIEAAVQVPGVSDDQSVQVAEVASEVTLGPASLTDALVLPRAGMMAAPTVSDYVVTKGDTLSGLFNKFGIAQTQVYQVMEADYAVLALDTLMPGNHIRLTQTETDLMQMELIFDAAHQVVYRRNGDGFEVEEVILDGEWRPSASALAINGSFSLSAQKAGIGSNEIMRIANLFDDKLDFNRTLRAGDRVQILRESQYIDGEPTGRERLLAVNFAGRKWEQSAYLHSDGNFYDDEGESLARAFMRVPLDPRTRITSNFNPRRKHPVTGRISPHNGTDFAGRTGTPVLASGDGRVTRAVNHPIAGKYIVIDHGGNYRSRYLHLSKINVRKGQQVTRGQKIGAVGATGRVTGPHLHYELHIKGRPVNPMTAKIPMATAVKKSERGEFDTLVADYRNRMTSLTRVASAEDVSGEAVGSK